MKIVLASASPRRQELLKRIVDDFDIIIGSFDEEAQEFNGDIEEYVCSLALGKARAVIESLREDSIIIGCDTIVYLEGKVLGKPKDELTAVRMLKELSGKTHKVYSGIAMINSSTGETLHKSVCTDVKFMKLTDNMIETYVKSGQCFGKAGAYGIQDEAAVFVESINGCYYNVVGFSLNNVFQLLREMGVNL